MFGVQTSSVVISSMEVENVSKDVAPPITRVSKKSSAEEQESTSGKTGPLEQEKEHNSGVPHLL